jgi:lipoyl-dependent peroxiredoxin
VPRIRRQAAVAWEGSLSRGTGTATATSSGSFELPIDLPSRIADAPGKTSPEELLAAAHAGCFSTSLAGEIARAGGTVHRLDVTCTITLDEVEGKGHLVVASELDVAARAAGLDEAGFETVVRKADDGCTFSALIRASATVTVQARLLGDDGSGDGG